MEKPMIDALAQRIDKLERQNRKWKCAAGVAALILILTLTLSGLLGSRAVVAQQPEPKAANPAPRRMEYKVTEVHYVHQVEKPIQDMAAEGWEVVQIVPTSWSTAGQGQGGNFSGGIIVTRRPIVPGR